jgi:hypothetical protein
LDSVLVTHDATGKILNFVEVMTAWSSRAAGPTPASTLKAA